MFRKKIIGPPGPTGTSYYAWLAKNGRDDMYKMTDRSLYGARPPFAKVFAKEEKLDGMSEDELAKRVGITLMDNSTDCNCGAFETEIECEDSGIGCIWHPLFESCHPPELIDGSYLESYFKLYLCISDVPRSQYILSPSAISQTTKTKKTVSTTVFQFFLSYLAMSPNNEFFNNNDICHHQMQQLHPSEHS